MRVRTIAVTVAVLAAVIVLALVVLVAVRGPGPPRPDPMVSADVGTLAPTVGVGADGVPTQGGAVLPSLEEQPGRPVVDLAGTWLSRRVVADHQLSLTDRAVALPRITDAAGGREQPGYDDGDWDEHPVPSPENRLRGTRPPERYEDGVWYRRTVTAPRPVAGQRVRLVFDAVASIADVWVNGRWAGYHEGAYTPFVLDVTDALASGGPVTLAVRVDNPPLGTRSDTVPAQIVDWENYTGIIGGVRLEYVPGGGIARLDAVPRRLGDTDPAERIGLDVTVVAGAGIDPATVSLALAGADVTPERLASPRPADLAGAPEGFREVSRAVERSPGRTVVRIGLEIDRPRLWSPGDPNLHVLTATVPGDAYATQVGLRTVGVAAGSPAVLLNGRAARFTGLNRHQEWPGSGRTVTDPARIVEDLREVRGTGATLLRTAHYPNDPLTYLVADRLGLAVIEETPMWWSDAYDFADAARRGIAEQAFREMTFRDRNRASVIAWSAVNEARAPVARTAYLNRLVRDLRLSHPDGRLVTQSAAADRPGPDDPSRGQVDVAGFTLYPGTFDDTPPEQVRDRAADFLRRAHAAAPDQPVWITEFGAYAGTDGALADRQADLFDAVWSALRADPVLSGAAWWALRDGFTPIAGTNTFGLAQLTGGDGRGGTARPVDARLRAAYAAAPPVTSGPVLAQRPPLVPGPVEDPTRPRLRPGLLSDFSTPDPAEPAGDAALSTAGGALVLRPQGPVPGARVYLYAHPVDLARARALCVTVTDPGGGARATLRVEAPDGTSREIATDNRAEAGRPTRLCAQMRDAPRQAAFVTVRLRGSAGGDLTVDDLVATLAAPS